jgi:hypothetical protein
MKAWTSGFVRSFSCIGAASAILASAKMNMAEKRILKKCDKTSKNELVLKRIE